MSFKHLQDLWPGEDEWSRSSETFEEQKARLLRENSHVELIELTPTQRVIKYKDIEGFRVQGTFKDWMLTVQANTSLENSIAALKQIAFYAHMGVRIPESLAYHFAEAVDEMVEEFEQNENKGLDDSAVSKQCLKVLGRKLGMLGGHRRPKVSYKLVGYFFDSILDQAWSEESEKVSRIIEKEGLTEDEIFSRGLDDEAFLIAEEIALGSVQVLFELSEQQAKRYLEKYEYWKDWREEPK